MNENWVWNPMLKEARVSHCYLSPAEFMHVFSVAHVISKSTSGYVSMVVFDNM